MYEVEIKVPADLDAVRRRLRGVDAEKIDVRRQRDVYYDAPHRDFAETDEALRLRRETSLLNGDGSAAEGSSTAEESSTAAITYKGPLIDDASKTREERETAVDDGDEVEALLAGLGFDPAATVRKEREYWLLDGFTVTLDAVEDVGEFVEVEREVSEASAIDATREGAEAVLERLGLDPAEGIRTSYLGLLLAPDDTDD